MSTDIGRRIASRRVALGLTQKQLAHKIGVTRPTISYWETGAVGDMKGRNMSKLCEVLDISDEWLLKGGPEDQVRPPPIDPSRLESELLEAIRRLTPEEQQEALQDLRDRESAARMAYERLRKRFERAS